MPNTLRLRVVTPERLLLDEEVEEVTAPGLVGEFGVLPNHAAFLSALDTGRLSYKKGGTVRHLAISSGFAEVVDNVVTVLADAAEFAEEIQRERARAALQRAEEKLRDLSPFTPEYEEVRAALKRAQTRLEVAGLQD